MDHASQVKDTAALAVRIVSVLRPDLEIAFPWVCYLPPEAIREFLGRIDSYRAAARIYSRKAAACC